MDLEPIKQAIREVFYELGLIEVSKRTRLPEFKWQKYNLHRLEVGESILVKGKKAQSLGSTVQQVNRKVGYMFRMKTEKDGVRIWRIK